MNSTLLDSALIFLSALILEDVAVLGAAALVVTSTMSLPWAAASSFAGVWCGDLGLYFLALRYGRPVFERPWFQRLTGGKVDLTRSEQWFSRHGSAAIALSRVVPGSRLPTFLSAGLLKVPAARFVGLTSATCALWVAALFALTYQAGPRVIPVFRSLQSVSGRVAAAVVFSVVVLWLLRRCLSREFVYAWRAHIRRIARWEFWPTAIFYIPVAFKYIGLAVRYRSLTLPTSANPGMHTGGVIGESKFQVLDDIQAAHPDFVADSYLLTAGPVEHRLNIVRKLVSDKGIEYPFVLKPNVGQRGFGFRLVHSEEEARIYLKTFQADTLVQRYVPGPLEAGIFYYRLPDEARGRIFSIGEKVFPVVTGDGVRSLEELIWADPRASLSPSVFLKRFAATRKQVPDRGETIRLVEAGNHCQGAMFLDGSRLYSAALEEVIDSISKAARGFFIGRYDIRFQSETELRQGRGFRILEVNGISAEPADVYDPANSLLNAWRTLFRQWEITFAIAAANRAQGQPATAATTIWKNWVAYQRQVALHPISD